MNKSSVLYARIGTTIVVAIASFALVFAVSQASADGRKLTEAETKAGYQVNELGLTYEAEGRRPLPSSESGKIPETDLIRVIATNGEIGYMYSTEKFASLGYTEGETLEETEARIQKNLEEFSHALANAAAKHYNSNAKSYNASILTPEAAKELLIEMQGTDQGVKIASKRIQNNIDNSKSSITITVNEDDMQEIYDAARLETAYMAPVYKEDGKTIIGEHRIIIM